MLSGSNALDLENYFFVECHFSIVFFLFLYKRIFNLPGFLLNMSCCDRYGKARHERCGVGK